MLENPWESQKWLDRPQISEYQQVSSDPVVFQTLFPHRESLSGTFPSISALEDYETVLLRILLAHYWAIITIYPIDRFFGLYVW